MKTPRELPHKSIDADFGLTLLEMDKKQLQRAYEHILNPENGGDTIVNQFELLTSKIFQVAIARFFWEGISAEDFKEMLGKSALAACNYFRLITNKGKEIQLHWEGESRSVLYQGDRVHHTADHKFNMGFKAAILADQHQEIEYLSDLDLFNLGLQLSYNPFTLRMVALQSLCKGRKNDAYFDAIEKFPKPNRKLNEQILDSECKILLALEKEDSGQLHEHIDRHLVLHKKMYDNDVKDMRRNYFGLMSIPVLTVLVLAGKRDMMVEVDNPYLPKTLLA